MKLSIRPEKLIARDSQPVYSLEAQALINGSTVMVTGAGGSIGSEIVRQCVRLGAKRIVKVDADESALFKLSLDVFGHALFHPEDDFHLVDITDHMAIGHVVKLTKPDIIFHAAAKKHLPLTQSFPNMAVRTNVFGTAAVIKAAVQHGVPRVINISTDKAANPSSVLGWSKRLAELIGAHYTSSQTYITSVRFGNVLGSNGSLLPVVQHKLDNSLPVQVTHPEVTRFFMTIPEATGLVIEATKMSEGGEVFILDMGDAIKVVDLINDFARLSDRPKPTIEYVGLRPGEKLHEELFSGSENHQPTLHPRINAAMIRDDVDVPAKLDELEMLLTGTIDPQRLTDALTLDRKEESYVELVRASRDSVVLGAR